MYRLLTCVCALLTLSTPPTAGAEPDDGPSAAEAELIWRLNRLRIDPRGETPRLLRGARLGFAGAPPNIDLAVLRAELDTLRPAPPVVFDPHLHTAARNHASWLIANNREGHTQVAGTPGFTGTDPFARCAAAGYAGMCAGENVFVRAVSPRNAHVGFLVDWGPGPDGLLPGRGHRLTLVSHAPDQVGIALLPHGSNMACVQVYGRSGRRWAGGIVWRDKDGDGAFDASEGLGGVSVRCGELRVASWSSGLWSLPLPDQTATHLVLSAPGIGEHAWPVSAGTEPLLADWRVPGDRDEADGLALLAALRSAPAGTAGRAVRGGIAARAELLVLPKAMSNEIAAACAEDFSLLQADRDAVQEAFWWKSADACRDAARRHGATWRGGSAANWFEEAASLAPLLWNAVDFFERARAGRTMNLTAFNELKRRLASIRGRLREPEWREAASIISEKLSTVVVEVRQR
jgi:hypothetical protein